MYVVTLGLAVNVFTLQPLGGGASVNDRQIVFPTTVMHACFLPSVVRRSGRAGLGLFQSTVAAPSTPRSVLSSSWKPSNLFFVSFTKITAGGEAGLGGVGTAGANSLIDCTFDAFASKVYV